MNDQQYQSIEASPEAIAFQESVWSESAFDTRFLHKDIKDALDAITVKIRNIRKNPNWKSSDVAYLKELRKVFSKHEASVLAGDITEDRIKIINDDLLVYSGAIS